PSPRWSVTDQIGHLRYFDGAAALAIRDPDAFSAEAKQLMEASLLSETSGDDFTLRDFRLLSPADRLESWRQGRAALAAAAGTLGERDRVSWYGPSMGAKSFVTARLMEAWAHGTDVCDTVGAHREPTHRLRHVAQLGYITRAWTYINRGLAPPDGDVRVELAAPSGDVWYWGDADTSGEDAVTGPALDFCLVVTQRRHVSDTALEVSGERAREWLTMAQAFAGPPTDGPRARAARERSEQERETRARAARERSEQERETGARERIGS
ncbi:MAG: TIGR03084 family protein, partial [Acidimicrobiaceae bacterium]|nr:TIGR03084 family protein [Acidimicrobiaceae bacterium]